MRVIFNPADHTYTIGGRKLISVTTLLKKHGLAPDYTGIDAGVLERAANKGIAVHEEIEDFIKKGLTGFTQEFVDFMGICEQLGFEPTESEVILPDGDLTEEEANALVYAGTADIIGKIGEENVLVDIKTTAKVNKRAYAWQLSLYEKASGRKFDRFYIFHLGAKSEPILLERIPEEEVERLIDCERAGTLYSDGGLDIPSELLARVQEAECELIRAEQAKKEAEATAQEYRAKLCALMEEQNISSFETADKTMLITRVAPTTKTSIDGTRLKKELPEIAEKYAKTTNVKGYVKVTIREG